jgi:hypothetical protein
MAQKGLLRKKLEQLEVWGAVSVRPEPEAAEKIAAGDEEQIRIYFEAVQFWVDDILTKTLAMCLKTLGRSEAWTNLAKRPADFDKALELYLKGAGRCMKLLHRIPDHRPGKNEERDLRLVNLQKKHPALNFGQLAIKYNQRFAPTARDTVDSKTAHMAITRFQNNQVKREREAINHALAAAQKYLATHSLTDVQLRNMLPTPKSVLDLLTAD